MATLRDNIADAEDAMPSAVGTSTLTTTAVFDTFTAEPDDPGEINDYAGNGIGPTGWLKLVVPSNGIPLDIGVVGTTDVSDTVLFVYDEVPTVASLSVAMDDDGGVNAWSYINRVVLDAGTYYVCVTPYDGTFWDSSEGGNVTIEVKWLGDLITGSFGLDAIVKKTIASTTPIYPVYPTIESYSTTTVENANSMTINMPSGVTAGDLLIACIQINGMGASGNANFNSAPSGWTSVLSGSQSSGGLITYSPSSSARIQWYKKTATASEPSTLTWGTNLATYWAAGVMRISSASTTTFRAVTTGSQFTSTDNQFSSNGRPSISRLSIHAWGGPSAAGPNSVTPINPSFNIGVPNQAELFDISASQRAALAITYHAEPAFPTPENPFANDGIDTHGITPSIAQPPLNSSITIDAIPAPYIGLFAQVASPTAYTEVFRDTFTRVTTSGLGSPGNNWGYAPINRSSEAPPGRSLTTGVAYVDGSELRVDAGSMADSYRMATGIDRGYIQFDFFVQDPSDGGSYYVEGRFGVIGGSGSFKSWLEVTRTSGSSWVVATRVTSYTFTPVANTWYTAKAEVLETAGDAEKVKVWVRSTSEPGTWNAQATPTSWTSNSADPIINLRSGVTTPARMDNLVLSKRGTVSVSRYSYIQPQSIFLQPVGSGPPYAWGAPYWALEAYIGDSIRQTHPRTGPHTGVTPSDNILISGNLSATALTGDTLTEALQELEAKIEQLEQG